MQTGYLKSTKSQDLGVTKKAFVELEEDDISRRYFAGEVWQEPTNYIAKILFLSRSKELIDKLHHLYPYQNVVELLHKDYNR